MMQLSPPPLISSLSRPYIHLSTLFSKTLIPVFHPYGTTGEISSPINLPDRTLLHNRPTSTAWRVERHRAAFRIRRDFRSLRSVQVKSEPNPSIRLETEYRLKSTYIIGKC
jgi:hypothetical protein